MPKQNFLGFNKITNFFVQKSKEADKTQKKVNKIFWLSKRNSRLSCATLITSHHQNLVNLNRNNLRKIIKIVHFLSKQGLPFRGRLEGSDSKNRGNILELIEFVSEYDNELHTHINK